MTTALKPCSLFILAWQALRLYSRHFLPLFLLGGLPGLLYALLLLALGQGLTHQPTLPTDELFSRAQLNAFLWNLPNLLLLSPLASGALVAAVTQLRQQEPLQPAQAIWTALQAWKRLLGAHLLLWLLSGTVLLTLVWLLGRSEPPAWRSLGGLTMIFIVLALLGY